MPYTLSPTDICLREKTMFLFYSCLEPIIHILMSFHQVSSCHWWWTAKASTPMGYYIGLEPSFGQWNCINIEWITLLCSGQFHNESHHWHNPAILFWLLPCEVKLMTVCQLDGLDRMGRVINSIFLLRLLRTHMYWWGTDQKDTATQKR